MALASDHCRRAFDSSPRGSVKMHGVIPGEPRCSGRRGFVSRVADHVLQDQVQSPSAALVCPASGGMTHRYRMALLQFAAPCRHPPLSRTSLDVLHGQCYGFVDLWLQVALSGMTRLRTSWNRLPGRHSRQAPRDSPLGRQLSAGGHALPGNFTTPVGCCTQESSRPWRQSLPLIQGFSRQALRRHPMAPPPSESLPIMALQPERRRVVHQPSPKPRGRRSAIRLQVCTPAHRLQRAPRSAL